MTADILWGMIALILAGICMFLFPIGSKETPTEKYSKKLIQLLIVGVDAPRAISLIEVIDKSLRDKTDIENSIHCILNMVAKGVVMKDDLKELYYRLPQSFDILGSNTDNKSLTPINVIDKLIKGLNGS